MKPENRALPYSITPLVGKAGDVKKRQYLLYLESGGHTGLFEEQYLQIIGIANANGIVRHFNGQIITVDGRIHHYAATFDGSNVRM